MYFGGASYSVLDDILTSSDDENYDDFDSMMPEPEPESTAEKKARRKAATVKRAPTSDEASAQREAIRLSTIASGLTDKPREKEIVLMDINKDIFYPTQQVILKGNVLDFSKNNTVTLSQSLRKSGVIIVKIKFKSTPSNSVFFSHLSFWPKLSLPNAPPSSFSQKNFEIFRKGNIHLKLEKYNSQVDNQPLTIKVSLDPSGKFVIPSVDYSAISEGSDTIYIKLFLNILLKIINHESKFLFPGILGAKKRKTRRKSRGRKGKSRGRKGKSRGRKGKSRGRSKSKPRSRSKSRKGKPRGRTRSKN